MRVAIICDNLVTCQPRKKRAQTCFGLALDDANLPDDAALRATLKASHSVNNPRADAAATASTGVFAPIFASSVVIRTFISSSVTLKALATSDECLPSASH